MGTFDQIPEQLVEDTIAKDDLNDALFDFQNAIGIDDGGVAGVVFSGGWDDEWPTATQERRREMMAHYIGVERSFAA